MRSPSAFSDVSVRPSFLRTTPAKKPRTECCCQPVAFMIAAIEAPAVACNIAVTRACFEPGRCLILDTDGLQALLGNAQCQRPVGIIAPPLSQRTTGANLFQHARADQL